MIDFGDLEPLVPTKGRDFNPGALLEPFMTDYLLSGEGEKPAVINQKDSAQFIMEGLDAIAGIKSLRHSKLSKEALVLKEEDRLGLQSPSLLYPLLDLSAVEIELRAIRQRILTHGGFKPNKLRT